MNFKYQVILSGLPQGKISSIELQIFFFFFFCKILVVAYKIILKGYG